jgi:predicted amidohydrolase YtcJ
MRGWYYGGGKKMRPDLVMLNANIVTLNPAAPRFQAAAIKFGRISALGTTSDIEKIATNGTSVIDLEGKTVLPGFIDTHVHLDDFGLTLRTLNLEDAKSVDEVKGLLAGRVNGTPKGEWVIGRGWNENRLKERRLLTRWDLDEVSPGNPVYLHHFTCHATLLNSKGLEASGIDRHTKPPAGGWIDVDASGEPTGFLRSNARFMAPVGLNGVRPRPDLGTLREAILIGVAEAVKYGLTGIHVPSADHDEIKVTQELAEEGRLPIRITLLPKVELLDHILQLGIHSGLGDEMLRIGAIKIFSDGSLIAKTAAVKEPFEGEPNNLGLLNDKEVFTKQIIEANRAGMQIAVHAVGDRAIEEVLEAYEKALKDTPRRDHRHRIEHGSIVPMTLREKARRLGVVISTQPELVTRNGDGFEASLGEKRMRYTYPIKSLLEEGVVVSGSSDCPLTYCNPLKGIWSAVSRESENSGRVITPEEKVSIDQAIHMYTVNAAYVGFEENLKGTIEEGKLADFTVLSKDPYTVKTDDLTKILVEMTMVGGKVVYDRKIHRSISP